jgi:hypothetical protein
MKGFLAVLPCMQADDTSTLLMMKSSLSTESAQIEHFMKGIEGRNVTQMASLMQNLVESQLFGDGVTGEAASGDIKLDADISDALKTIKQLLLGDIQRALQKEHSIDQTVVDGLHTCWDACASAHVDDQRQVDEMWGILKSSKHEHEACREVVHAKYIEKVKKCNELDLWIDSLKCPECYKEECVVVHDPANRKVGDMLQAHVTWAKASYAEWQVRHAACAAAVREHEVIDTKCDRSQGSFESDTCNYRQALWTACNVNQMACCKRCSDHFDEEVNRVECAEKDRKIDWSATKKIECYIDVLMASPTDAELQAKCKADGKACINQWREDKYKSCEEVCTDVDFETGEYSIVNGVNTTHRKGSEHGNRCTLHLDIHFPAKQPCPKCPPPITGPCEEPWIKAHYHEYDSKLPVPGLEDENECHPDLHQQWWAYSRAECRPCPTLIGRPCIIPEQTNPSLCAGTTIPGATDWKVYGSKYIYVDVDTSKCKFLNTPKYVTSMQGTSSHWKSRGSSEIYSPTPTGFRIYIYLEVSPATANQRGYAINWVGGSSETPVPGVCSGQAANWGPYGSDMVQTVDTSDCGFTARPVYVTSMQGKSSHWTSTGSSEVYSASTKSFTQYIDGSDPNQAARDKYMTNFIGVDTDGAVVALNTKCPFTGGNRLFRKEGVDSVAACRQACDDTTDCNYFSYQKHGTYGSVAGAGNYDGVCMGCMSSDAAGEHHVGFSFYDVRPSSSVCAGRTSVSDWKTYSAEGIYVDVDTSKCGFERIPVYVSSLHGKCNHWVSTGSSEIYSPNPNGFRIYIATTADIVSKQHYKGCEWSMEWVAVAQ